MERSRTQLAGEFSPDLKRWFDEKSRTFGWDLIIALDRKSVNQILLQNYIEKFDSQSYLPPMSGVPETGEGERTELVGLRYDTPRLSFGEADLSEPMATLRMQLVGGVRLQWNTSGSMPKLRSISLVSPTNADILEQPVKLRSATASAVGNRIILDLGSGALPENIQKARLHCGLTGKARRAAGAWTARWLSERPEALREYVLSRLEEDEHSVFRPQHIRLLTQAENAGSLRGAQGYGEGAVLAFVSLEGSQPGQLPGNGDVARGDWRYMLGGAGGYSSCWVFDRIALSRLILTNAFRGRFQGPSSSVEGSNIGTVRRMDYQDWNGHYHAAVGFDRNAYLSFDYKAINSSPNGAWDTLSGRFNVPLYQADEYANIYGKMSWEIEGGEQVGVLDRTGRGAWGSSSSLKLDYTKSGVRGEVRFGYDFVVEFSGRYFVMGQDIDFGAVVSSVTPKDDSFSSPLSREVRGLILEEIRAVLVQCFMRAARSISPVVRKNILFAGGQAITLEAIHQNHDMVLAGHLEHASAGLTLNLQEAVIGAGTTLQLKTSTTGVVEWSVTLVEGRDTDVGRINSQGLYTSTASLSAGYAKVRISARHGNSATYALITISATALQVSPAIQMVTAGSQARYFVRGGGIDAWSWDTTGLKGKLVIPVPEPGEHFEDGEMQYTPPAAAALAETYLIDKVCIRSGNRSSTADIFVVKGTELYSIKIKRYVSSDSAELAVYNSLGEEVNVQLFKAAGGGVLNGNIVSSNASPEKPYIIVMVLTELPGFGAFYGALLLPLPLSILNNTASRAALMGEPLEMPTVARTPRRIRS